MIIEFCLYFLSFIPLWISVIIIDSLNCLRFQSHLWTEIISITLIVITFIYTFLYTIWWLKKKKHKNKKTYTIKYAKENRFITAEFIMTYVLPLFVFDFRRWDCVVLFLIFYGLFFFLIHRHKYLCTNLFLEFGGYRVFSCSLVKENVLLRKMIVSRNELESMSGAEISTKSFNNDYLFEIK